jgi:class 3 adenylate cyclase
MGRHTDVSGWLRSLGLDQYEAVFRDNAIDLSVLPDLTDQDLEKLGVLLGHRRKLLRAIAALDGAHGATPAAPAPPPVTPAPVPAAAAKPTVSAVSPGVEGERRYLTVMFCDLAGSTGISAQLDAEEWRDLVSGYLDAASAAVTGMGGHVAKKLGDGLLALFGYPVAQENDSERAARAALSGSAPHSRRGFIKARPGEYGVGPGSLPHRHRHCEGAEGAQFRAARGAVAGEALSVERPRRRCARRALSRARRLRAEAGVPGDCRSAIIARVALASPTRRARISAHGPYVD